MSHFKACVHSGIARHYLHLTKLYANDHDHAPVHWEFWTPTPKIYAIARIECSLGCQERGTNHEQWDPTAFWKVFDLRSSCQKIQTCACFLRTKEKNINRHKLIRSPHNSIRSHCLWLTLFMGRLELQSSVSWGYLEFIVCTDKHLRYFALITNLKEIDVECFFFTERSDELKSDALDSTKYWKWTYGKSTLWVTNESYQKSWQPVFIHTVEYRFFFNLLGKQKIFGLKTWEF